MYHRVRILQTSVAALLAMVPTAFVQAQITWNGSVDSSWNTAGNWSGNAEPTAADVVVFPVLIAPTGATINLTAVGAANSLTFSNSYTLTGANLTLGNVGTITVDDTFTATIDSVVGGTVVSKEGAGTLVLTKANTYTGVTAVNAGVLNIRDALALGTVAGGTTVAASATLELQGAFSTIGDTLGLTGTLRNVSENHTWSGVITINAGAAFDIAAASALTVSTSAVGSGAWTKTGGGTLIFTTDPNQTGPLTIAGGVVELNHTGATDFATTIQTGATLRTLTGAVGDGQTVTVNAGGIYDIRANDTIGRLEGGGVVTKGSAGLATLTLNSATSPTIFSGVIEDGLGQIAITKAGSNTFTLTGVNTYTGNTVINTGNITVSGGGRLSGGTSATIVSVGDNNGNDESLTLGSNADVIAGTLDRFADLATLRFNGTVAVTYNGAAVGGATAETVGTLDLAAGTGTFSLVPAASGEVEVTFGSLNRSNNNATGIIRGTGLGSAAGTANSSRVYFATAPSTVGLGGTGSSSSIIPFLIGGTSATAAPDTFLRYDVTNGVVPLGASDYAATIAGSAGQNVSLSSAETIAADSTINALRITTGGAATLNEDVLVRSGAVLFTTNATIGGTGTLQLGEAGRQAVIHASGGTAVTGTISANVFAGSGLVIGDAGGGANVIVLSGDNDIFGGIVVNNGILRLGSAGALNDMFPNDFVLRGGNSAVNGATSTALQLNGQNATVLFNGNDRLQGSTRIQNASATPATLTIITNVASGSNDGIMENGTGGGTLSLTKRGNATLTLEQTNTYTGTTEILGGTLQLTAAGGRLTNGTLGTTAITIGNGAVLNLNNANNANQGDRIGNVPINMHGGTFQFDNNQGAVSYAETTGALNVVNGNNTITTDWAATGQTSRLTFASLAVSPGAALNFQGFNTGGTGGDTGIGEGVNRNRVEFTAAPTLTAGGIIGGNVYHTKDFNTGATQDVVHFSTYGDVDPTAVTSNSVFAFSAYNTGAVAWTATTVANPAADVVLTENQTIEALRLGGGIDVNIGVGQSLNLSAGGLIHNGTNSTISDGTLTAGGPTGGELAVRVEDNLTTSTLTISSVISDGAGAVALLKTGADTLTLTGANTYTGRTTIAGGTLSIGADNNLGTAPATATAGHLRLNSGTLNLASGTVTLDANRGIEVTGTSNITAATGSNLIYNGAITGTGASLGLTGDIDMTLSEGLNFSGSLSVNGLTGAGTSIVALGGTNNVIGGSLAVGALSNVATLNYSVPGGTLSVGGANPGGSNLDLGTRTNNTNVANVGVMNLTGSDTFVATVDRVRVGVLLADPSSDQNTRGTLTIGTNSNITAATEMVVSDSNTDSLSAHPSLVTFGSGSNTLTTPLLTIGQRKANGAIAIAAGGTLTFNGFAPGTADLRVGYNNTNTGASTTGVMNMTGGTFIADLDEVFIGHRSGTGGAGGGATGTLTLAATANSVKANSLVLGGTTGDGIGTTAGTINMGGGSFSIATDVTLGNRNSTAGTAQGTLNLTGGTFTVGGNIVTTGGANATATVTLNGGTLDMTGGTISVDTFNLQAGTLRDVAQVFADDGATAANVTKTSGGIVTFEGVNAFTGDTVVNAGTLLVAGVLTGSDVIVNAGTLGGTGTISDPVTLGNGTLTASARDAILSPGASIGTLNTGNITFAADAVFALEINSSTGFTDRLVSAGTLTLGAGIAALNATDLGGLSLGAGETFTFITAPGGVSGFFAGLPDGAELTVGVNTFTIEYGSDTISLASVPEPGATLMLLGGLGSVLSLRRVRRRSTQA